MKKFRIVTILLALCLITSSFVGNTFAKYTSTASGSDSAVVAKWSIVYNKDITDQEKEIATSLGIAGTETIKFDLFNTIMGFDGEDLGDEYPNKDNDVREATGDNEIIAPGTSGQFKFSITNDSDVTASYTVTFNEEQKINGGTNNENPIPIKYCIKKGDTDLPGDTDWKGSLDSLEGLLECNQNQVYTVYWRWAFSDNDAYDTALGIAAATATAEYPYITVGATIHVEQVN